MRARSGCCSAVVDPAGGAALRARPPDETGQGADSLRFRHPGAEPALDLGGVGVFRACANPKRT
ncbi:hypothetical protein JHL17_32625 [Azospirillum sp. YIM B02556]|uniref:Uncharacterized protein n=1 Tax=Azospirillum endophyticum TaxID=2800326 RepID=A0ABS1FFE0_9PROT|nr:hypothetical protein [Azospirillum endophyticum]MBK1842152.1 hypothetical protein [Azospirillum endophyticum]